MGFHFRKSFKCGPVRFNLSNSGIGYSVGVKGLRVGVDGKGRNYIGGGKGVLRYRQYMRSGSGSGNSYNAATKFSNNENIKSIEVCDIPDELKGNGFLNFLMLVCGFAILFILLVSFTPPLNFAMIKTSLVVCAFLALPFLGFYCSKRAFHVNMGVKYFNCEKYELALQEFIKAEPMARKLKWLSRSFIAEQIYNCFINLEKYDAAIEFLKNNTDVDHGRDKLFALYFQLENWEGIIQYFEENKELIKALIESDLLDVSSLNAIYKSYWALNKYEQALEFAKSNNKISEKDIKIINCYNKLCKYKETTEYIQRGLMYQADEHPSYYALLGEAFLNMGQKEVALEALLQGPVKKHSMDSEMCVFRYTLGKCFEANNDKVNALKQYQKIYAYDTSFEDVAQKIEDLK